MCPLRHYVLLESEVEIRKPEAGWSVKITIHKEALNELIIQEYFRLKILSLKIPNVEFDLGYSMFDFTTEHIHWKPNFSFARYK